MDATTGTTPLARAALWLIPVHAALLAVGAVTHEPDRADLGAYAAFVTTGPFLAGHLVASVLGAALGSVGVVAALAFLSAGPSGRAAAWGAALTVAGNVISTAVFGTAAFAQPAIGRAIERGVPGMSEFDADVYGTPLVLTAVVGLLLLLVGGALLGRAVSRADGLRAAGIAYAVLLALFVVAGFSVQIVQPFAALGMTVAAVVIALRLPRRAVAPTPAATTRVA
ncbi:hypothetical protein [Pseudonocardia endophytica]|uniref:Uncharacterized protein n=1 Tax=Pseudonocardia endophytica TaxID=401976 RepID=A0A4R1HKR9_PSEEN|nr:hypothetical protein [Pseudonocardia endophytica]TCK22987.1 hypothetical protein EV378_6998 [Pseudonocardia endophytica]